MDINHFKATLLEMHDALLASCQKNGSDLNVRQDMVTRLDNISSAMGRIRSEIPTGHHPFHVDARACICMLKDIMDGIAACEAVASKALEDIRGADGDESYSVEPLTNILAIIRGDSGRDHLATLVNTDNAILQAINAIDGWYFVSPTSPSSDDPKPG